LTAFLLALRLPFPAFKSDWMEVEQPAAAIAPPNPNSGESSHFQVGVAEDMNRRYRRTMEVQMLVFGLLFHDCSLPDKILRLLFILMFIQMYIYVDIDISVSLHRLYCWF
jgi:hypothetical protein